MQLPSGWTDLISVFARCEVRYLSLTLDFHFDDLLDNLPTSPDAFIHMGSNVMKTLRRSTPNG